MKRLTRLICGASVLAMSASGAYAADLAPEPMLDPVWTGPYFGIGLGGYGSSNKLTLEGDPVLLGVLGLTGPTTLAKTKPFGFSGGGFLGYNFQFGENFVFGIEGDFYVNTGKKTNTLVPVSPVGTIESRTKDKYSYSFRGRLGYAAGDFMPYITGGYQGARQRVRVSSGVGSDSRNRNLSGYTIGGGIEWAATQFIGLDVGTATVRLEYRYSDYGKKNWNFDTGVPGVRANVRSKNTANQFLVGFAWKY